MNECGGRTPNRANAPLAAKTSASRKRRGFRQGDVSSGVWRTWFAEPAAAHSRRGPAGGFPILGSRRCTQAPRVPSRPWRHHARYRADSKALRPSRAAAGVKVPTRTCAVPGAKRHGLCSVRTHAGRRASVSASALPRARAHLAYSSGSRPPRQHPGRGRLRPGAGPTPPPSRGTQR